MLCVILKNYIMLLNKAKVKEKYREICVKMKVEFKSRRTALLDGEVGRKTHCETLLFASVNLHPLFTTRRVIRIELEFQSGARTARNLFVKV